MKFLARLLKQPYLWLIVLLLVFTAYYLRSSWTTSADVINNQPNYSNVQAGVEETPIIALPDTNPTAASPTATANSVETPTSSGAVAITSTNAVATQGPSITVATPVATAAPTSCAELFATAASATTQPLFLETSSEVCLKSHQINLQLAKANWKLSLENSSITKIVWQEPAASANGGGDLNAYGSPAFLIDKQLLPASKAPAYQTFAKQQWFHLTQIEKATWQAPVLTLLVATNDPTKRTATVKITLLNNVSLLFNMELSDASGVVSTAVSGAVAADEHFFGLGQRQLKMDQRGQRAVQIVRRGLELDPVNGNGSYAPYPFVLSTAGYGLLAETQRRNVFDMAATRPDASLLTVDAANLNLAFFIDSNPLNVLQNYTALIGRPPLPPPWDLGVWKNSIGGQERVVAEAQKLRDNQIPVSVLFTYDAVDPLSASGWDTQVFQPIPSGPYPNLAQMTGQLHALGYKTLTYIQEAVQTNWTTRYNEGVKNGYFLHNSSGQTYLMPFNKYGVSLIDFSNPAAVKWFQDGIKRLLVDFNFDGALQDTGDIVPFDAQFANGQNGYDMANVYPVLYAKASYEAAQKYKPDAVFLMRSSYLGAQQYQKATWEGDLINHWDWRAGLPSTIPAALNRSISGNPFISTEIAGYLSVNLPYDQRHELYLRWTQYGAFNPIMRDILGQQPADAVYLWSDAQTIANFKRYARVHTDLFPLFYTLAKQAHDTGLPIMRHPYLLYPNDPKAISQELEYFLGDSMLVAPIVTMGARERPVYLPAGNWVDFWNGQELQGGHDVTVPAPLDTIPVYMKAGAILPTLLQPLQTLGTHGTADAVRLLDGGLNVKIYGSQSDLQKSSFTLFDGTSINYVYNPDSSLDVTVDGNNTSRPYLLDIPADSAPLQVSATGETSKLTALNGPPSTAPNDGFGWWYDAANKHLLVKVAGSKLTLHLSLGPIAAKSGS